MGRNQRPKPCEISDQWPDSELEDPVFESVRRYVQALADATGSMSLRQVADKTGVSHTTLAAILKGEAWPDAVTVARTENGLKTRLWYGPISLEGGSKI